MFPQKTIFTGFAPNLTIRDVAAALAFLFFPWRWRRLRTGSAVRKVEQWLEQYFSVPQAISFDSGRSALQLALLALDVKTGDEILLPAYTCVVVVNAIEWSRATPIFVDIDENFSFDPIDLERKISPRTRVAIVQHTFGQPVKIEQFAPILRAYGIKIIEDCAHSLGAKSDGKKTGTLGDIGMFSFGSDKVISCARGGALITKDEHLGRILRKKQKALPKMALWPLLQHLFHGPIFFLGKAWYHFGVGKCMLFFARQTGLLPSIISLKEKRGKPLAWFPCAFPNALAHILLNQLNNLETLNLHRQKIAGIYRKHLRHRDIIHPREDGEAIYLRYTIRVSNPQQLISKLKRENIFLDDWYARPIAPIDTQLPSTPPSLFSCQTAFDFSQHSLNLPTHRGISESEAQRIIRAVLHFFQHKYNL